MLNRLREYLFPTRLRGLESYAPKSARQPQTVSEKRLARIAKDAAIKAFNFNELPNGDVRFIINIDGWISLHEFPAVNMNMDTDSELTTLMRQHVDIMAGMKDRQHERNN